VWRSAGGGGAAAVADAGERGSRAGPGRGRTRCQRRGAEECEKERGRAAVGHRHTGPSGTASGGAVETLFETKAKFK
jgi:hypothetical protein